MGITIFETLLAAGCFAAFATILADVARCHAKGAWRARLDQVRRDLAQVRRDRDRIWG